MAHVMKFEPDVGSHRLVGCVDSVITVVCMLLGLRLAALVLIGSS